MLPHLVTALNYIVQDVHHCVKSQKPVDILAMQRLVHNTCDTLLLFSQGDTSVKTQMADNKVLAGINKLSPSPPSSSS